MYYVVSKDPLMTQVCVHIGTHEHPITKGHCRDAMVQIWEMIKDQVAKSPNSTPSAISLAIGVEWIILRVLKIGF